MNTIPLPPPIRFPTPIIGPTQPIALPSFQVPEWEPIPVYREQIPNLNPATNEPDSEETEPSKDEQAEDTAPTVPPPPEIKIPEVQLPPLPVVPESAMVNQVTIPIVNIDVPLPKAEIVTIAVTTAGVAAIASVGGTMIANNMFRQLIKIFKPLIKTVLKKVMKARGKEMKTWSRQRLEEKRLKSRS